MFQNISYQLGEYQLIDLNIFVSDLILGIVVLICAVKLVKLLPDHLERKHWDVFFWLLGISAIIGGIGHAFGKYDFGHWIMVGSWALNILAIFKLERAVIEQIRTEKLRNWLVPIIWVKLVAFLIWLFIKQDYLVAAIYSGIGTIGMLLPVVIFEIRKKTEVSVRWFIIGFILSALAGLVFGMKWGLNDWLAHQDIGHYIVALSTICFYVAVKYLYLEHKLYPAREGWW